MKKALQKTRDMLKKYGTDAMSKAIPCYEHEKISKPTKKIKKIPKKTRKKTKKKR